MGILSLVNVEPLELEYLTAICLEENVKCEIYDGCIEGNFKRKFRQITFDVVVLSGYINSVDVMKEYARYIKLKNKNTKIIIGGVVAEVVPELLYSKDVDIIIHSGGFEPFRELLKINFDFNLAKSIIGICYRDVDVWIKNSFQVFNIKKLPIPNRRHFYKNAKKFIYLKYHPTAIMKTSYGCPYKCNFCYCKNLNGSAFISMDLDQIIAEIKSIHTHTIWIVDDIFLLDRERFLAFGERIEKENIKKNFIVYSRADFIVNNKELLPFIKKTGIEMVIVGLEAVDDNSLNSYNKLTNESINKKCVEFLHENHIECMGLFIAGIDYTKEDFRNLRLWIKDAALRIFTISVLTPLPGTELYEKYKDKLTSKDFRKYDFLHLHIDPLHMGRKTFYYELCKVYIPYLLPILKKFVKWR